MLRFFKCFNKCFFIFCILCDSQIFKVKTGRNIIFSHLLTGKVTLLAEPKFIVALT